MNTPNYHVNSPEKAIISLVEDSGLLAEDFEELEVYPWNDGTISMLVREYRFKTHTRNDARKLSEGLFNIEGMRFLKAEKGFNREVTMRWNHITYL